MEVLGDLEGMVLGSRHLHAMRPEASADWLDPRFTSALVVNEYFGFRLEPVQCSAQNSCEQHGRKGGANVQCWQGFY